MAPSRRGGTTAQRIVVFAIVALVVIAIAVPVVLSLDGTDGGGGAPNASDPTDTVAPITDGAAPTEPSTTTAVPTTASPVASAATTTTTTTTPTITPTTTTTPTTSPVRPCALVEVGIDRVVVFGNSTDHTFEPGHPIDLIAWPDRLAGLDPALFAGVEVVNEAQRGQTMGDWDDWGWERTLNLSTHLEDVVAALPPDAPRSALAVVAPSFIDLQSNGYDVQRALDDLAVIVASMEASGFRVLALPMNYVSTALDDRLPQLNPAVEEFNDRLAGNGFVETPLAESPLRDPTAVGGDDRWFDDFDGYRDDGTPIGADGFHPDDDGHALKAAVVRDLLVGYVADRVPSAAC